MRPEGDVLGKRKMHAGASVDVAKQAPRMLKQTQENQSQQKEVYKEIRALDSFNTQLSYESLSCEILSLLLYWPNI